MRTAFDKLVRQSLVSLSLKPWQGVPCNGLKYLPVWTQSHDEAICSTCLLNSGITARNKLLLILPFQESVFLSYLSFLRSHY